MKRIVLGNPGKRHMLMHVFGLRGPRRDVASLMAYIEEKNPDVVLCPPVGSR